MKLINRLSLEKSPYLRQHENNPVAWQPWSEKAFELATQLDRPVFLSIGYSTCHWCHVMEHESFEDLEVAEMLNSNFISIKVDREEYPDIDQAYMRSVQALTGHGGWPMTVVMMPDKRPFFGGTYYPKQPLLTLLSSISNSWKTDRSKVSQVANELVGHLAKFGVSAALELPDVAEALNSFCSWCESNFDRNNGGFGSAPKFPPFQQLRLLLRIYARTKEATVLSMVEQTLRGIANGGIYDFIGGGLARYSTDQRWQVPHFEKMLYDNVLLIDTCLEMYQVSGDRFFAEVAKDTINYLNLDMHDSLGGFYTAEDADSQGIEGKFYTWTWEELGQVLSAPELEMLVERTTILPEGNFELGGNIIALKSNTSWEERAALAPIRDKLKQVRIKRERPDRDEKILTGLNGLAIGAFAHAGRILNDTSYIVAAERSATFLKDALIQDGHLLRRWISGESHIVGLLEDYAFLIHGLIELYQATWDEKWLNWSRELLSECNDRYWKGDHYENSNMDLPIKTVEQFDDATPNPSAIMAANLFRLGEYYLERSLVDQSEAVLKYGADRIRRHPQGCASMLIALDLVTDQNYSVVCVANQVQPRFNNWLANNYLPNIIPAFGLFNGTSKIGLLKDKLLGKPKDSMSPALIFICEEGRCLEPSLDFQILERFSSKFQPTDLSNQDDRFETSV